jgi:hypothetical protein
MLFFSEEDKAANKKAAEEKAAVARQHRRNAPGVAGRLVDRLEESARSTFRGGSEVREIRANDGRSDSNFVDQEILTEVLIAAVEKRFGRSKSTFRLSVFQSTDFEDRDCWFHGNSVTVIFDPPLT